MCDSLVPGGGSHREEPLWSREFPSPVPTDVAFVQWPNGDFALTGDLSNGSGVGFDSYPVTSEYGQTELPFVARIDRSGIVQRAWTDLPPAGLGVDAAGDISLCGFASRLIDDALVFDSVRIPQGSDELGSSFNRQAGGRRPRADRSSRADSVAVAREPA